MKCLILVSLICVTLQLKAQNPVVVADSLYAVGEFSLAFEKLEKINHKTEAIYLKLAKYQSARGKTAAAIENYKVLLQLNPERVLTALEFARTLVTANLLKEADSVYQTLIEKYPENSSFYYQRGLVRELQKEDDAIDLFKKTIDLDNHHQGALYKLAKNELQKRSYDMAKNYCLLGLEEQPEDVSLLSILAQTYSARAQYQKAIPHYEKLLELGQESEFIFAKLGYAYYQEGQFLPAIDIYNKSLELEDRNAAVHHTLGKLYAAINDLEKSEQHLLMSILLKKQSVDAEYLSLALTYKLKLDYKNAYGYLQKALEENPDNERALYEKAIAADNYFKDLSTKINHYEAFLKKYESIGDEQMLQLARNRLQDLKREQHLSAAN